MMTDNIKNGAGSQQENKNRICNLYGVCGKDKGSLDSHLVSHFGLSKLKEKS